MEEELLKKVVEIVGEEAGVTRVALEGPDLGVYTRNPSYFLTHEDAIPKLATTLKKRINLRSDPSILSPPEHAKEVILSIIPKEAEITNIEFLPELGRVIIEAKKPGLAIGKDGKNVKTIVEQTGWLPKVVRAPAMESNILKGVRKLFVRHMKERQKFLRNVSVRIMRGSKDVPWVRIHFLGGARQVGRSALLLETPQSKIILDLGIDVASESNGFPLIDVPKFSLDEIDAVVITHAHLDHCGFLPMLYKLGYDGPTYVTPPTRDLMALLQFDYVDVLVREGREPPYTERDVKKATLHVITRNYGEVTDVAPDLRITFHNAGHILGSAIVHVHVGQGFHNVIYTGDLKFGFSRLHNPASTKYPRAETLIIESTYGGREDFHPSRKETEEALEKLLVETMEKKGILLIPAFAVGRAQEILLTLEEMYRKNNYEWPIFVDGMIKEASAIYTAYPEYLKRDVQARILKGDSPFEMEQLEVVNGKKREDVVNEAPAVIIAPSGALTGGPAVEYFKLIAGDERNAIALVGYQFEGSLGRKLQKGIREIPIKGERGKLIPLQVKARVETLHGFSGHSDRRQLEAFLKRITPKPSRLLVVHGEEEKAVTFARDGGRILRAESYAPRLLDVLRLR